MRLLKVFIFLLLTIHCSLVHAGYTIHVDQQRQEFVQVNGPYGPEIYPASAEASPVPPTLGPELCRPGNYSPFSTDPARRTRVFRDSYGVASSADILSVCPQLKAALEKQIRAEGARRLSSLASPYLPEERDTWPQQQAEAAEWRANPTCGCTMIRQIAASRGIFVEALVGKIEENVGLFLAAAGAILGQQQKLLDHLAAETDIDKLLAITWQ